MEAVGSVNMTMEWQQCIPPKYIYWPALRTSIGRHFFACPRAPSVTQSSFIYIPSRLFDLRPSCDESAV